MAAALVLTYSRGGWIGAGVAAITFLALQSALRRDVALRLAPLAIAAIAVLALVPQGRSVLDSAVARGQSTVDVGGQSTRLGLWKNAFEMAADRPVLGSGPDTFPVLFPEYRDKGQAGVESRNVRPESAHSTWLDQLVGGGLLGLGAFVFMVGAVLRVGILGALRAPPGPRRFALAGLAAGLAGYLGAASFAFAEAMTGWLPWIVGGAIVGLTWAKDGGAAAATLPAGGRGQLAVGVALGGLGLLFVGGAAVLGLADLRAGQALRAPAQEGAERHARAATRLNPLHPGYLLSLARIESGADTAAGHADAAATFHRHNGRFAPTAYSLVAEASALIATGADGARVRAERLLAEAEKLDPYNAEMRAAIASLREQ